MKTWPVEHGLGVTSRHGVGKSREPSGPSVPWTQGFGEGAHRWDKLGPQSPMQGCGVGGWGARGACVYEHESLHGIW